MHIDKGNDNVYLRTTGAAVPEASEFAGFEQESTDPPIQWLALSTTRSRASVEELLCAKKLAKPKTEWTNALSKATLRKSGTAMRLVSSSRPTK